MVRIVVREIADGGTSYWRWECLSSTYRSLAGGDGFLTATEAAEAAQSWAEARRLPVRATSFYPLNGGEA